jgi:hypothetical protein
MSAPLPIDTSGIDTPLLDLGHEAIRVAVLNAIQTVWTEHTRLVGQVNDQATQITALQQQVAALTPAPAPAPTTP